MNMNQRSSGLYCQFHPLEVFVGVCPHCLNERLITLASLKQSHFNKLRSQQHRNSSFNLMTTKILALSSLWNRLDLRVHKASNDLYFDGDYDSGSCSSQEDSFISMKFEENGVAFWDKENKSDNKKTGMNESLSMYKSDNTSVMEQAKPRGGTHRWMKRISHVFDQIRWKSTVNNTNMVY